MRESFIHSNWTLI